MQTSEYGINLVAQFEGLRLRAYRDIVGVPTIGYGHTRDVRMGMRISKEKAVNLLIDDLYVFERGVEDLIAVDLRPHEFDALVSFSFNVGLGALRRSTLRARLNQGDFEGAAREFLKWNYAGGRRVKALSRRRRKESKIFKGLFAVSADNKYIVA